MLRYILPLLLLTTSCETLKTNIVDNANGIINNQNEIESKLSTEYATKVKPLLEDTKDKANKIKSDAIKQDVVIKEKNKRGIIFYLTILIPLGIIGAFVLGYFGMKELALYSGLMATVCISIITYYDKIIILGCIIGVVFILKIIYSAYCERKIKKGLRETVVTAKEYRDRLDHETRREADEAVSMLQSKATVELVHQEKAKIKIKASKQKTGTRHKATTPSKN